MTRLTKEREQEIEDQIIEGVGYYAVQDLLHEVEFLREERDQLHEQVTILKQALQKLLESPDVTNWDATEARKELYEQVRKALEKE